MKKLIVVWRVSVCAILLAPVFTPVLAQDRPSFRADLNLVTIPCTVVNAEGGLVTDLTRPEFQVSDNGSRRIITNFWFDRDTPLTLGILVDASESQRDALDEHRATVLALLDKLFRPGDQAFVVWVNQDVRLWSDLTGSVDQIRQRLAADPLELVGTPCARNPLPACGGSPLWNAIYETARLKLQPLGGNKALLILTDGFDTGSTHTWRQAADEVERAEASLYAIQYQSGLGGRFAPDLYRMLEESGGSWFGNPAGDYRNILSRMESDLRQRYVLGFRPDSLSGRLRHEVKVEVTRPGLRVRARQVYFQPSK